MTHGGESRAGVVIMMADNQPSQKSSYESHEPKFGLRVFEITPHAAPIPLTRKQAPT